MSGILTECCCGHAAYQHHFNNYGGDKGADGRGRCAHNNPMVEEDRCNCISFLAVIEAAA